MEEREREREKEKKRNQLRFLALVTDFHGRPLVSTRPSAKNFASSLCPSPHIRLWMALIKKKNRDSRRRHRNSFQKKHKLYFW